MRATDVHLSDKPNRPARFRRQSGLIAAKVSLNFLEGLVSATPVVGSQLRQLVHMAKGIVNLVEAHHLNQKSNDELVNKICDTMEIIALAMNDPNVRSAPQLVNDLNRVKVVIEEIDKHMRVHYKKHNYERLYLTLTREDGDTNRSFCQQLDHAMQQFSFSSGIQLRLGVQQLQQLLERGFFDVKTLLHSVITTQSPGAAPPMYGEVDYDIQSKEEWYTGKDHVVGEEDCEVQHNPAGREHLNHTRPGSHQFPRASSPKPQFLHDRRHADDLCVTQHMRNQACTHTTCHQGLQDEQKFGHPQARHRSRLCSLPSGCITQAQGEDVHNTTQRRCCELGQCTSVEYATNKTLARNKSNLSLRSTYSRLCDPPMVVSGSKMLESVLSTGGVDDGSSSFNSEASDVLLDGGVCSP